MAFQDGWARPLADKLVDLFRVSSLDYLRVSSAYDPTAGSVVETVTTFASAGAVTKTYKSEAGGVGEPHTIECWINMSKIGDVWPTTADRLTYQGQQWKITSVTPMLSGDQKYACKIVARCT